MSHNKATCIGFRIVMRDGWKQGCGFYDALSLEDFGRLQQIERQLDEYYNICWQYLILGGRGLNIRGRGIIHYLTPVPHLKKPSLGKAAASFCTLSFSVLRFKGLRLTETLSPF